MSERDGRGGRIGGAREVARADRRSARLSRRSILAAALELVQREGAAALTMRRLAEEMGTAPMSLYRHVADKQEVLDLLVDQVSEELAPVREDLPPREAIIAAVGRAHAVIDRNRWLVEVVLAGQPLRPGALRLSEHLYAAMASAGLDEAAAARFHVAIWQYLWGHIVVGHGVGLTQRSHAAYLAGGGDGEAFPAIRRLTGAVEELSHDEAFRAGFLALVDGFLT
ncbi:TetR/AcrR family transcriptional regulator [Nonomuraea polychroma]|uniref:TetR/AcrR family transcriptional regulator n=1 Tax=Nonomuraea polychroma TaxID=46176 RepID=UPI003D9132E1